ncbi:MAG: redox-sensing transcriptional repressor Rex [Clostridiales bacterium]|nr:redox-sensing transcriptional repressor Rex [Clostridiales bacterium]
MKSQNVSEAVVRRLPRYYRHLETLANNNVERVSSSELAEQLSLTPSQVRQDFNCFGGFGQQGYGYPVKKLYEEIGLILGLAQKFKMIIAGAGNIGRALCNHEGFHNKGFEVQALFDINENLIGQKINGKPVLPIGEMGRYIKENAIDIGVIAARRTVAQSLADEMVAAGIKAIWNFVPTDINAPVPLENVQLIDSMLVLSYRVTQH